LLDPAAALVMSDRLATRVTRGDERYEIGFVHPSGEFRRLEVAASPLRSADGEPVGSLGMVSDVTDARRVEQELRRAALHAALTDLPNRALFQDRLEQALTRGSGRTAVLLLDLDRFKLVNDSRGHEVGDVLLVAVAHRLSTVVRRQDTLARFGGDEFIVLAEDVDEGMAEAIAEQLLAALALPVTVDGLDVYASASVGVALSPPDSAGDLLRYADSAMYASKAAGRGRVRLCDPALASAAEDAYALTGRLRTALAESALRMEYQPIIELGTGRVIGVEALARWSDPDLGEVSPEMFVGLAEANGLAPQLDRWAIERAMQDGRTLRRAGVLAVDAYVSINLSASNVGDRELEALIVSASAASGLAAENVMLEVTEGAVMTDAAAAVPLLRRLRARGFKLAIDDFGTGQSSLAYVRDLPITHLKIDRSFVAGLRADTDAVAVAASVVDLGRAVGMTVIAEGVEEEQQAVLLRHMGCHAAQGWLWSPALPPSEFLERGVGMTNFDVGSHVPAEAPRRRPGRAAVQSEHGLDRILSMHRKGASLSTVAAALNADGYLTPTGLRWHQTSVARAIADTRFPAPFKTPDPTPHR
jgi:diguanylate cyclase (GGDEF)-like protein